MGPVRLAPFLILLFPLVLSCSSALKRANTLAEGGAYEEALAAYDAVLQKDPVDEDAIVERKRTRFKYLERKLVEARLARISGRMPEAAEILVAVENKYLEWGESHSSKAIATWEEELDELDRYVRNETLAAVSSGKSLRVSWLLKRYLPLLKSKPQAEFASLREKATQQGGAKCAEWQKARSPRLSAFNPFVARLCQHWGVAAPPISPQSERSYGKTKVSAEIAGLNHADSGLFEHAANQALKASPWFSPDSKQALPIRFTGDFKISERMQVQPEIATYYVDEVVKRKTRDGKVVEDLVRSERHYSYFGNLTTQEMTLDTRALIHLVPENEGNGLQVSYRQHDSYESRWHNTWFAPARLSPVPKRLRDPGEWLRNRIEELPRYLETLFAEHWKEQFCRPDSKEIEAGVTASAAAADRVLLCAREKSAASEPFVRSWFDAEFALTPEQVFDLF